MIITYAYNSATSIRGADVIIMKIAKKDGLLKLPIDRLSKAAGEFIDEVYNGDKRIIILNGEPIGAILRKAKEGDFICNFHSGGTPHKTEITEEDLVICYEIKNFLIENHIYLAGIDIIGGFLTEINITSPTCLQEINRANETKLEKS